MPFFTLAFHSPLYGLRQTSVSLLPKPLTPFIPPLIHRGGSKASASAYIRISPEEIADDYPFPVSYEKEEEETDEMLLFDEEMMDADPEYLPRRLLHDFAIYNAEVRGRAKKEGVQAKKGLREGEVQAERLRY